MLVDASLGHFQARRSSPDTPGFFSPFLDLCTVSHAQHPIRQRTTYPGLLAVAVCPAADVSIPPSPRRRNGARTESTRRTCPCRRCSGTGTCSFAAPPPGTGRGTCSSICCSTARGQSGLSRIVVAGRVGLPFERVSRRIVPGVGFGLLPFRFLPVGSHCVVFEVVVVSGGWRSEVMFARPGQMSAVFAGQVHTVLCTVLRRPDHHDGRAPVEQSGLTSKFVYTI